MRALVLAALVGVGCIDPDTFGLQQKFTCTATIHCATGDVKTPPSSACFGSLDEALSWYGPISDRDVSATCPGATAHDYCETSPDQICLDDGN